jgi:hypothetical protein
MMKVTSEEEKNAILSSLKSIPYETRQEQIAILNEMTLKFKIFPSLPIDDSSVFHRKNY